MALQPNIALQVHPMQIADPLESAGKALAIRGAQQRQALGAQELQAGALHIQNQQQEMADQKTLREALLANNGDREAALKSVVGKINPSTYATAQKSILDQKKELGELDKQKREALDFQLSKIGDALAPVLQAPPERKAAVYQQGIGFLNAHGVDTSKMNPEYTSDEDVQASLAHANGYLKMSAEARADKESKEKTSEHDAKMPGIIAESDSKVKEALGEKPVQPYEKEVLAGQAEGRADARNNAAATQRNAAALLALSRGRFGLEQEHAEIAKKVFEQTYGEGANPALQGVEPKLRTQAMTQAQKAADEFTKAMESSAHVQSFIDLARKGNKAAGSNLPMMGAESIQALNGIKRINRAEIAQYEGAGSLLDRIQGRIGKIAAGQPIPADVMKDIEELHKTISGNAANAYNTRLNGINQNYRSNFQPVKGDAGGTKPPAVGTVEDGHRFKGGDPSKPENWEKQ